MALKPLIGGLSQSGSTGGGGAPSGAAGGKLSGTYPNPGVNITSADVGLSNVTNDTQVKVSDIGTAVLSPDSTNTVTNKSIDAVQLTGVLPTLDGSALTALTAANITTGGTLLALDGTALTVAGTTLGTFIQTTFGTFYAPASATIYDPITTYSFSYGVHSGGVAGWGSDSGDIRIRSSDGLTYLDNSGFHGSGASLTTVPGTLTIDSGWTANTDGGTKSAVIPSSATINTVATALDLAVSGAGAALKATAEKVKALEAALVALLYPNA